MYTLYRRTRCYTTTLNSHNGDGCHACLIGVMRPVSD